MIRLVVGLGNPGRKYKDTRHNLGFQVIDLVAKKHKKKPKSGPSDFHFAKIDFEGRELYLVKPDTFMNDSGIAVSDCLKRWEVRPEELLVICDDLSLPVGRIRIRANGSDGGHNGLKSIIAHVGSSDFPRLRMGIGPNPPDYPAEKYVLKPFHKSEKKIVKEMIQTAREAVEYTIAEGVEKAMNRYNAKGGRA
jgi:peptidyl-tRNA hydrolase, PTH1 family